jgi:hypothetical protein
MPVNYDSSLYGYDQIGVTYEGADSTSPKTRFVLDSSTLNNFAVGIDGTSPAFTLDTSALDGSGKLDGYTFQTNAVGSAVLGGVVGLAEADVIVIVQSVGVAELGGLAGVAVVQVAHDASGSAVLGAVTGEVSAIVVHSSSAVAGLGAGVATAVSSVLVRPYGEAQLGLLAGSAQATVVPQPTPTPSYPGGNPWYRRPKVVVDEVVEVVEVELPRLPRRVSSSGSSVVSLSSVATAEVTWSILEDEADLLLLV